ncbi:DUF1295 domain-containing protein [Hymenobacter sp. BT175]|nr:DUF1295 domain-containing protein [Hymenobacter translucens]
MVLLIVCWILYYTLHSVLATQTVKDAVIGFWPAAGRFYRLAYNQLSVWLFLLIFRYQLGLPEHELLVPGPVLTAVGSGLMVVGLGLAVAALRGYDLAEFAGWAYVRRGPAAALTPLSVSGMNRWVRHPLYLGLLVGLLGFLLTGPTSTRLAFVGCTLLYLLIGTRLEERKLLRRFGLAYARYQRRVPMLLPAWPRAAE